MKDKVYISKCPRETKSLAKRIAKKVLRGDFAGKEKALTLFLLGELGGGKTTFVQGFAKGLGIEQKILSPTFVMMKCYKLETAHYDSFCHLDYYRVGKFQELSQLGIKNILDDPRKIVAIEWAEKFGKLFKEADISISFILAGKNQRIIRVKC